MNSWMFMAFPAVFRKLHLRISDSRCQVEGAGASLQVHHTGVRLGAVPPYVHGLAGKKSNSAPIVQRKYHGFR